jgi:hypothetical protein
MPANTVPAHREYLGDAVYAQCDEIGRLVLTTEDGYRATNTIVLEPTVIVALERYLRARFYLPKTL